MPLFLSVNLNIRQGLHSSIAVPLGDLASTYGSPSTGDAFDAFSPPHTHTH